MIEHTLRYCVLLQFAMAMTVYAQSSVVESKHNLSATGPGSIRAASERQVCVFCHTPHSPQAVQPLWNHEMPLTEYTLYTSDYLTSLNYTAPNQPALRSKLCLSCHDGTIAIGAVYNNMGAGAIIMDNAVTTMPTGSAGYIGTSLENDHPVGHGYDNSKDKELVARAWPWQGEVKLDPDAANGTVECQTCHEPHNNQYGSFLRMSNQGAALCGYCHNKMNWNESIHKTSVQIRIDTLGHSTTIGELACRSCHKSHGGQGVPYLLVAHEEQTCYASQCHGSNGTGSQTKNIQSELEKMYRHPVDLQSARHKNPDKPSDVDIANRHAECADCHNPHQAQKGLHTLKSNQVSAVLRGVRGVVPGPAGNWQQPTTFTEVSPSSQENQICFRCHSYYAFGPVPGGVTTIVGPSGGNLTDQAMEFNPENRSAHPVQVALNNQSGSSVPRALAFSQLSTEWNSPGNQTMYCSDCHGNDEQTSVTVPQGPHGSEARYMLTGRAKYWPANGFGELWSLNDIRNNTNNWQNDLFCVNCHPMINGGEFVNNVHEENVHQRAQVKCITCHVVVPHGAKRSRLIGYESDVAPYNYLGTGRYDRLVMEGFFKASGPRSYEKENCSMTSVCHGTEVGPYEP